MREMKSRRSPLGKMRGLGSSKSGTEHWLGMQITSVAMIPLLLYLLITFLLQVVFIDSVVTVGEIDKTFMHATDWVRQPLTTLALVLFLPTACWHGFSGVHSGIVEDYIHNEALKVVSSLIVKFTGVLTAVIGVMAVLKIFFGT